jgi:hypothetical protein
LGIYSNHGEARGRTETRRIKMKIKQYSVNEKGIAEIQAFLAEKHKLGGDQFDLSMLQAWAHDAEFQLSEGNSASIEIRSFDSISGHTENYTISPDGLDCEEIEIEE